MSFRHRNDLLPTPSRCTRPSCQARKSSAEGRLVLLHDPDGQDIWAGDTRCVAYVQADVDPEIASDPMLAGVGWSWLIEALDAAGAAYTAEGGRCSRTTSERFGALVDHPVACDVEIRASWSPTGDLGPHLVAFGEVLCTLPASRPSRPAWSPSRSGAIPTGPLTKPTRSLSDPKTALIALIGSASVPGGSIGSPADSAGPPSAGGACIGTTREPPLTRGSRSVNVVPRMAAETTSRDPPTRRARSAASPARHDGHPRSAPWPGRNRARHR